MHCRAGMWEGEEEMGEEAGDVWSGVKRSWEN
jgi:hypothetical protein